MDPNQNQNVHRQCPTELPHYFTDYADGSNWGYQEMKVYYYVNLHRGQMPVFDGQVPYLYDGEAFFSNLSPTPTPITVFRFFDVNCASPHIARQHIRDSSLNETEASPFLGTHRFSCWTQGFVDVVYNKLPTETIYSWFSSSRPRLLFEFDTSGKLTRSTPTGLRPEVQNTLKKILDGLRKLHDQELATGIIDDLHQFSLLVKHVISHNPLDKASSHAKQEFPHSYDRFMGHINYLGPAPELGLEEVRYVRLQSMDKWHKSIHKGDLLWNDFKKQKDLYESGPTYLLDFHENVVKHHKDNNTNARLRGDNEVIQELHRCFPKFASEIYFEYALIFDSTALTPWISAFTFSSSSLRIVISFLDDQLSSWAEWSLLAVCSFPSLALLLSALLAPITRPVSLLTSLGILDFKK
ncbi:hypothetical protein RHMOL_Rhmol02G0320200 [Rhododendron molle]|uniref:Uncharacterized protein n=1 Tax=Rhododendron molle TaxID=49168 RepID=A0ACC0PY56_RHOML|nr:hypothetical protein RHMOL_Rhmol02G0320200 [Rhododendron molle]